MLNRLKQLYRRLPTFFRRFRELVAEFVEGPLSYDEDVHCGAMRYVFAHLKDNANFTSRTIYRFPNYWGAIVSELGWISGHRVEVIVVSFPRPYTSSGTTSYFLLSGEVEYFRGLWQDEFMAFLESIRQRPEADTNADYYDRTPHDVRLYPGKWFQMVFDHLWRQPWACKLK